jgi:hypothetical protein
MKFEHASHRGFSVSPVAWIAITSVAVLPGMFRPAQAQPTAPPPKVSSDTATPPEDAAKEKDVRKLLELTGSAKLGVQIMDQMMGQLQKTMPNVPAEFWDEFKKEADVNQLIELIVPVYMKHFSREDLRDLIAFYESPVGRKLTAALPQIAQESMAVGRQWGMELGQKIAKRLQDRGYQKKT